MIRDKEYFKKYYGETSYDKSLGVGRFDSINISDLIEYIKEANDNGFENKDLSLYIEDDTYGGGDPCIDLRLQGRRNLTEEELDKKYEEYVIQQKEIEELKKKEISERRKQKITNEKRELARLKKKYGEQ